MKKQNLYNVTVYTTLSKDVLVYAENEDAALNYVQDVCDNTDLISFDGREILDVTAEDVEEIAPFDSFEAGNGGDADSAVEKHSEGSSSIKIVGSADGGSEADDEEAANERKVTEARKCSGDACANCGKCEKRGAPTSVPSSAAKEAEALRKLTELLGCPFVGILIE